MFTFRHFYLSAFVFDFFWCFEAEIVQRYPLVQFASFIGFNCLYLNFSLIYVSLIAAAGCHLGITAKCVRANDSFSFSGECQYLFRIFLSWSRASSFSQELTLPDQILLFFGFTGPLFPYVPPRIRI